MVTAEFTPSVQLCYQASRQIAMSTPYGALSYWTLSIAGTLLVIGVPLVAVMSGLAAEVGAALTAIAAIPLVSQSLVGPLIQKWRIGRSLRYNASARSVQRYEIGSVGFRDFGDGFSVELGWDKVHHVAVSKDYLLLFISKQTAYYVPRSLLTDAEIRQVIAWAKALTSASSGLRKAVG